MIIYQTPKSLQSLTIILQIFQHRLNHRFFNRFNCGNCWLVVLDWKVWIFCKHTYVLMLIRRQSLLMLTLNFIDITCSIVQTTMLETVPPCLEYMSITFEPWLITIIYNLNQIIRNICLVNCLLVHLHTLSISLSLIHRSLLHLVIDPHFRIH